MEEIVHAAHALDKRPDVKAIIITGDGPKAFAAGADIMEMADQTYDEVSARLLAVRLGSSDHWLRRCSSVLYMAKSMSCLRSVHLQACFFAPSAKVLSLACSHLMTHPSLQPACPRASTKTLNRAWSPSACMHHLQA